MSANKKCSPMEVWRQDTKETTTAAMDFSFTSKVLLLLQSVGLLRQPNALAGWKPTVLLLAWMAAPIITIASFMAVNMEKYLTYKERFHFALVESYY